MPRRAAMVTQADVARALRAAKQAGAECRVEIDGAVIRLVQEQASPQSTEAEEEAPIARKKKWRL